MPADKHVFWGVPDFPKRDKDEFILLCKMEGKDYKKVLAGLVRSFNIDRRKAVLGRH